MMKIYMSGALAAKSAIELYESDKQRVDEALPEFFIEEFLAIAKNCIEKNTNSRYISEKYFNNEKITAVDVGEGGIFAALWELCEEVGKNAKGKTGCEVILDDIYVDQHVIEVLELFAENPYELSSEGCFVIATDAKLESEAADGYIKQIGNITDTADRVIISKSAKRYLSPPARQKKDIADRKKGRQCEA